MNPSNTTIPPIPTPAARSRRVFNQQEKADYLSLFEKSAMTQSEFCREMGLTLSTFAQWRRSARQQLDDGLAGFAEVLVSAPGARSGAAAVTLHLPDAVKLEVSAANDQTWHGLGLLLKTLRS